MPLLPPRPRVRAMALFDRFAIAIGLVVGCSGVAGAQVQYEVFHSFPGEGGPRWVNELIQAADGDFYGTSAYGGGRFPEVPSLERVTKPAR